MAGIDSYRDAISGIESSGRYNLLGPVTRDGDRAYGKYQIMGKNVGPWTREVLGREMSPQEFASDPAAQDAVFNAKFGGYVSKYGPEGAARAWFAGEGGMNDPNRKDVLGTSVAQYASKFNTAIGAPQGGGGPAPQGGSQMNPLLMMQNEQTQEQPQQGGLLGGLFNDPGKMAALQLLMSGLNPFSKGNEMEPFIRAAQLRQTQDYNRKIDERDYGLRERQFLLNQQNTEADNKRADEAAKRAGLTPAAQAAMDLELKPGTPEYKEFINSFYRKKTDSIEDQVAAREKVAERLGLKKGSPQYQSFVGTGKLGRDEPLSVSDRKAIASAEDELPNLQQTVELLNRAKELNSKTFTGYTAGIRGQIGSKVPGAGYLIDQGAAKDTLEFENLMSTEAVTTMANTLKGATTDFELREFKARLSDPATPPEIRGRIIDRMKTLAERQLKINIDRLNQLREGEYYKPGGGASAKPGDKPKLEDPLGIR